LYSDRNWKYLSNFIRVGHIFFKMEEKSVVGGTQCLHFLCITMIANVSTSNIYILDKGSVAQLLYFYVFFFVNLSVFPGYIFGKICIFRAENEKRKSLLWAKRAFGTKYPRGRL